MALNSTSSAASASSDSEAAADTVDVDSPGPEPTVVRPDPTSPVAADGDVDGDVLSEVDPLHAATASTSSGTRRRTVFIG